MKLEQLRQNLLSLPENEAFALFQEYYDKRAEDVKVFLISTSTPTSKPTKHKANKKGKLTKTQIDALNLLPDEIKKKLGLV